MNATRDGEQTGDMTRKLSKRRPDAASASVQTRLSAQLRATIRGEGRIGVWERMGSVPLDAQAEVYAWLRLPLQLVAQIRVRVRVTVTVTVTVTLP